MPTIDQIKMKVRQKKARIYTAQEISDLLQERTLKMEDVDVVTTATRAVMSGTYAVLSFPVGRAGEFSRATYATLNGVPAYVGPCPNERLGLLDVMVYGTAHRDEKYGGGHLFRDLVAGKKVQVEVGTAEGRILVRDLSLGDMQHARLYATRHCFMNYSAFVNPGDRELSTIFHALPFRPGMKELTFSGCGLLNPLKNDPCLETVGVGTRILLNGRPGFVIGKGTRFTLDRPNLSGFADLKGMSPELMGGFVTAAGPECIASWAVPIAVTTPSVWKAVTTQEKDLRLPVMDVESRQLLDATDYFQVWEGRDLRVRNDPGACLHCQTCQAASSCPMEAIEVSQDGPIIKRNLCFNCGLCATLCPGGVFSADLGFVPVKGEEVPIVLRQSDRARALDQAEDLKQRILEGSFELTAPVQRI